MPKYMFGVYKIGLSINQVSLPGGVENEAYSQQLTATGGATPYEWTVVSGSLGDLTLGLSTGLISGTPLTAGTLSFRVRVEDAGILFAERDFSIVVAAVAPDPPADPVVTTSSLPNGQVNSAYTATLQASGGTGPYSWDLASGSLPAGLSLSTGGVISGTPTTEVVANFTVRVTDDNSATGTRALTLTIAAVTPLSISTAQLSSGEEDVPYSRTLTAVGGFPPYSWSVSSGTLPTGLSLGSSTGTISGTPTVVESKSFTITVEDDTEATASKVFSIEIKAAGTLEGPHEFYEEQIARPEAMLSVSHSWRSKADLASVLSGGMNSVGDGGVWDYIWPADAHPEAQDAAKLVSSYLLSGGARQLQVSFAAGAIGETITSGSLLLIPDFYHTQEYRDHIGHTELQHKFYKINMGGQNGSGESLLTAPKRTYRRPSVLPNAGFYNTGHSPGNPSPDGVTKGEPFTPSGPDTHAPINSYQLHLQTWTREWLYVQMDKPGNDPVFSAWSAQYLTGGKILGTTAITSSTAANPAVFETAAPHNLFNGNFVSGSLAGRGAKVTISGHSDSALNGAHLITWIDETRFSIPVAGSGGTGGVVSRHYHAFSQWVADESRGPVCLYRNVPVNIRGIGNFARFDIELHTSKGVEDSILGYYVADPPTVASPTVVEFTSPHSFVAGEQVWIYGFQHDVTARISGAGNIPSQTRAYVNTVISPTSVSLDISGGLSVTDVSTEWLPPASEVQLVDLGDIGEGDSFTLTLGPATTTSVNYAEDMSSTIRTALIALSNVGNTTTVSKTIGAQSYTVTFPPGTDFPHMTISPTGFTPGGVTTVEDGFRGARDNTKPFIGLHGLITKVLTAYCRNLAVLRNVDVDEDDDTLFRRPVR